MTSRLSAWFMLPKKAQQVWLGMAGHLPTHDQFQMGTAEDSTKKNVHLHLGSIYWVPYTKIAKKNVILQVLSFVQDCEV